jgi:hypothetical protein
MDRRNHGAGVLVINAPRKKTLYYTHCEALNSDEDKAYDVPTRKIRNCAIGLHVFKKYFKRGDQIRIHCDEKKIGDMKFKPTASLKSLAEDISRKIGCEIILFHRFIPSLHALQENKQMLAASHLASGRRTDCVRILETVIGASAGSPVP